MNLVQIARKARFEVDAIRTGNVSSALWADEEVYSSINAAVDRALRVFRLAGSEVPTKVMASTDASVDLVTESYAPSSLQLVSGTLNYTLPPDLVSIVSIVPLTSGFDGIRFRPLKTNQKVYIDQRAIPTADLSSLNNDEADIYYTRIGRRTIRFVPTPQDTIDVELVYTYRPPKLKVYSTGTAAIVAGSLTTVTGTGTLWVDAGMRTPAEFVTGSITAVLDLGLEYATVTSINSNTQLTMRKSQTAVDPAAAYRLIMVPVVPEEYHDWLAQMAGALLFRKINIETSDKATQALEQQLLHEIQPEVGLGQMQESQLVDPFELP